LLLLLRCSLLIFSLGLAWNLDPPNRNLPHSWDDRHALPCPASSIFLKETSDSWHLIGHCINCSPEMVNVRLCCILLCGILISCFLKNFNVLDSYCDPKPFRWNRK
jgi:hypothetical protein